MISGVIQKLKVVVNQNFGRICYVEMFENFRVQFSIKVTYKVKVRIFEYQTQNQDWLGFLLYIHKIKLEQIMQSNQYYYKRCQEIKPSKDRRKTNLKT